VADDAARPIAGDLQVVAGDIQGDSMLSWVKTLLADASTGPTTTWWCTRAMYGGVPLVAPRYLLDRGGKVRTSTTSHGPPGDRRRPLQDRRELRTHRPALLGRRGRERLARGARAVLSRDGPGADPAGRPAVIVLPASWVPTSPWTDGASARWNFVNSLLSWNGDPRPPAASAGQADRRGARPLIELADSHEVIPFAYDQRPSRTGNGWRWRWNRRWPPRGLQRPAGAPPGVPWLSLVARTLQLEQLRWHA
jgi:hypothetical protein